jgi:hypothetical protein
VCIVISSLPACDRVKDALVEVEPTPPPFTVGKPYGWITIDGRGVGPIRTLQAPDVYGGFNANIQIFREEIADPSAPSNLKDRFWRHLLDPVGKPVSAVDQESAVEVLNSARGPDAEISGALSIESLLVDATYLKQPIRQWKIIVVNKAGDKRYALICTALIQNYSVYEPLFRKSIESFDLEPVFAQPSAPPAADAQPAEKPDEEAPPSDEDESESKPAADEEAESDGEPAAGDDSVSPDEPVSDVESPLEEEPAPQPRD